MKKLNRRQLVGSSAAGAAWLSIGKHKHSRAYAGPTRLSSDLEIEDLANRIIECEQNRAVDLVTAELSSGRSKQDIFLASFIAGMRYHGHHSAYVAFPISEVSNQANLEDELLPLFYYLSVLKFRAKRPALRKLDTRKLPAADKALGNFHAAIERGEQADAGLALLSLGRNFGYQQGFNELWKYAAERNHNSGGHTAISVVNTYRTLQVTGWRCAETALQFAATDEAWHRPGGSDLHAVNWERAGQVEELPRLWANRKSDSDQVIELLNVFRKGKTYEACDETFSRLKESRATSGTIWDVVFLLTTELVVRYQWVGSKMLAGHSVTCVNALNYVFRNATDSNIRLYALLEAVEWAVSFLQRERDRPALRDFDLLKLEPKGLADTSETLDKVFSLLPPRRFASMHRPDFEDVDEAMKLTFSWANRNSNHEPFWRRAQFLMSIKSTPEVHDFKYPIALMENCLQVSPRYRPYLTAAAVHVLHGTDMEDSPIVAEGRERLTELFSKK